LTKKISIKRNSKKWEKREFSNGEYFSEFFLWSALSAYAAPSTTSLARPKLLMEQMMGEFHIKYELFCLSFNELFLN
jgi:hypothetical protein